MVEILLVGAYGRMGQAIQDVIERQEYDAKLHSCIVEQKKQDESDTNVYEKIEDAIEQGIPPSSVIIDFSTPANTLHTISVAVQHAIPIVIGTTGFTNEEREYIVEASKKTPVLLSSNMSRGITSLLKFLPLLVTSLGNRYDVELIESHHKNKKDAPSGTALSIASCLARAKEWELDDVANYHREGIIGSRPHKEIGIQTIRGGGVAGEHTVFFLGEDEEITITHRAFSRRAFAQGAVQAAIWLHKQPASLYSMLDME